MKTVTIADGDCMSDVVPSGSTVFIDDSAPIFSGDLVSLVLHDEEGLHAVGKRIELTRDGRAWACCNDGVLPLDVLPVVAVHKVVKVVLPAEPVEYVREPLSAHHCELMQRLSRDALHEWATIGYPPRQLLEFVS